MIGNDAVMGTWCSDWVYGEVKGTWYDDMEMLW